MKELRRNKPLATAAAKAGMSERTARKWRDSGKLASDPRPGRHWRTREDPLEALWPEAEALLRADPGLQAKAVFEELLRRHPGQLQPGQLRTLQRRFRAWRVRQGPDREVYFEQEREPGVQCQSDFTDMGGLGVTIRGERYKHLVYRFVLPYSNWESVAIASSETFEALVGGLQESLWKLGGVPREHRTDNLSAATHELRQSGGRAFNRAYEEFLAHYGLEASRNYPGNAHENGDVESAHDGSGQVGGQAACAGATVVSSQADAQEPRNRQARATGEVQDAAAHPGHAREHRSGDHGRASQEELGLPQDIEPQALAARVGQAGFG